jgi:NADP-dependent 3-hydroxy acid dehydrogenase YdfG
MRLENKVVVVTGASSGMGHAIATLFVNEGAKVVAVARRKERLDALAESLKNAPGMILPFVGDISDPAQNDAMIDFAVEKFGRLDVLVNNAGIMDDMSPVGDLTDEMLERLMKVNTYGPVYAMRKAVKTFLKQESGCAALWMIMESHRLLVS